ncbi:hypothetical protein C8R31_10692 [Nitrosospira sp. Nsp2]|nr:hypothetical protein C8R31_10692 [Nitrosospira sp. Nsp2]
MHSLIDNPRFADVRFTPMLVLPPSNNRIIMKIVRIIRLAVVLAVLPALSGCWYLVAGGAGVYGGYKMKEKGYTLHNPIAKEKSSK